MHINILTKALSIFILVFSTANLAVAYNSIRKAGDNLQIALPLTAAGLTLYNNDTDGAIELSKSLATTVGITDILKYSINEKRPNGGDFSFPSGHTSISFSSAEFMRQRYGHNVGVPAYLLATFVGYSRIESKQHYPHDVLAGAFIGIISSHLFTTPFQKFQVTLTGDTQNINVTMVRYF
jgi:membrane-associated phospholipid phosphatase